MGTISLMSKAAMLVGFVCASATLNGCAFFSEDDKINKPDNSQVPSNQEALDHSGRWISVDTARETVAVMSGKEPVHVFSNAAFGSSGVGLKRRQGDNITPKGQYRLGWINPYSKFHRFLGLNYPSIADAERGLSNGLITKSTFEQIKRAHDRGAIPPQYTALGGQIGIHGNGRGSLLIHRVANWTSGCIALENSQMDTLMNWAKPGMLIDVH
jgi:L,D-peptidoglycan transpeptidase YkuD (ErfK/YbiS/YcfS/YnhG family)